MNNLNNYDYYLPDELIAKFPLENRTDSRLLVLKKDCLDPKDDFFKNICSYLNQGDALVLNNTKVIPARIYGQKITGSKVKILIIKPLDNNLWTALLQGKGPFLDNSKILLGKNFITVLKKSETEKGTYILHSDFDLMSFIQDKGEVPLPPYLRRKTLDLDKERYQTVYAKDSSWGAIAAPTAGLHFSTKLLDSIIKKNIRIVEVTLNVGPGTFLPISCENIDDHKMHKEFFILSKDAAQILNQVRKEKKRIIAVGSTVTRVLEQVLVNNKEKFIESFGETDLFIKPGFKFLACDAIITNFHLPRSTLFLLICSILGRDRALLAYQKAIEKKYRFFSYGDACYFEIGKN